MKNTILTALTSFTLLTTGCAGFLDEELKSSLSPDNTYTTTYGFEVGVTGLYINARWEYDTWDGVPAAHGACPYEVLQISTDVAATGFGDGSLVPFENMSLTPSSSYVNSFWNWSYSLISNSNQILEYSENPDVRWDKETDKIGFQAEARFFRAYGYRYLVYLFGDIPWVDKIQKDFQLNFTRTPKADILAKMIEDLEFAAANLPSDPDKVLTGRLTSWAAKHQLAEVYLMANELAKAEAVAKEVIDAPYFKLTTERFGKSKDKPGDAFADMFKVDNQNRTSGNLESIWVMQLEYNTTGGGSSLLDWTMRAWVPRYYDVSGFIIDEKYGRGRGQIVGFKWWMDNYEAQDMRNSEHNIKRDWYYNDPSKPELFGTKAEITPIMWETGVLSPVITKFFYGVAEDPSFSGNNKDRLKFRLAETYLFLAEALIQQNKMDEAAAAINVVRQRSNATSATTADMSVDYLLDERLREMVGEEQRRFTLARLGKLYDRATKYNTKMTNMERYHELWPVPQVVRDANTEAAFPQNPGYEQ